MSPIRTRLEREALGVARLFREGVYGSGQPENADSSISVVAAVRDLEERCLSSARDDCLRAFRAALLSTDGEPPKDGIPHVARTQGPI